MVVESLTLHALSLVSVADYARTILEITDLIAAEPDRATPEWDRLEALTLLAAAFEIEHDTPKMADIEAR